MFERNRVDTRTVERRTLVPVEITLEGGEKLRGRFHIPNGRTMFDVLNGPNSFLDFEPYQGDRALIAKSRLADVRLVGVPDANVPSTSPVQSSSFDPHQVLGIDKSSTYDDVREAYHRLSKIYHPDRYANADLPEEVTTYLSSMSRRINAAYAALAEPLQVKKQVQRHRAEPIYVTPGRETSASA